MSARDGANDKKLKEMQERNKERNLIAQQMKQRASLTIEELSKVTGLDKSKILRHLIAMKAFGKVQIVGERDNELLYSLQNED